MDACHRFSRALNTIDAPLNQLGEKELVPGAAALEKVSSMLR